MRSAVNRIKSEGGPADDRKVVSRRNALTLAASLTALTGAVCAAMLLSELSDWERWELAALLMILAVSSDMLTVEVRSVRISGSFLAIVLAMALLGPAPAAVIGIVSAVIDAIVSRLEWRKAVNNVANFAVFPIVGGVLLALLVGDVSAAEPGELRFALAVLIIFMATNFLNFAIVAAQNAAMGGPHFLNSVRTVYGTVLPSEFATGLLTAGVAFSYGRLGVGAVILLAVVLFVFQYLLKAGVEAFERGEELGKRTRELASLQVGLLSTVLQTLSMRDAMTARHSAAVARYSREVARLMGLPEREQDLIHTAALLHDIGKFIFPDSILFADRKLTDEEWETVKLHPEQGAKLVGRIEGYGPIAEIVHSHHERFDGRGYPAGLAGTDIPLGSRIIAAADTYDVMTSRDSYRRPVSSEAALAELRRVAGSQLDPEIVKVFEGMVLEKRVAFRHADEADFELELGFERRVADYARPRAAA
jgi:putative nucleotidyltransferase with HDIG domain